MTRTVTKVQIQNKRKQGKRIKVRYVVKRTVELKDSYGDKRKRWQELYCLKKSSECAQEREFDKAGSQDLILKSGV